MTEEMKNDYQPTSNDLIFSPSPVPKVDVRGYVHLSPEATDQLNRIEEMLKRLIGEDESVATYARMRRDGTLEEIGWMQEPDATVTITEDGRMMYEVDKP